MQGLTVPRGSCGRLPTQALIEDELWQRWRGVSPVGYGLGRLVPLWGATCAGECGWGGGLAQVDGRAGAWVMKAMMRIWPPHSAQRRGKIASMRARSTAQR
jgi:hypothetical protein